MTNKYSAWSEGHNRADDSMQGLGGDDESVDDLIVKRGVVLLTNCQHCGRQWKGIITWPEVCSYYIGQPVKGTAAARQGIVNVMPCNGCQKRFRTITDWDEVRRYVDVGIRMGYISPEIKAARRR